MLLSASAAVSALQAWGDAVSCNLAVGRGVAAARSGACRAGRAAAAASPTRSPSAIPVDVELVLAVDVSYSMDPDEQALQREGYVQALTSREFLQALRKGAHGKIAITYFEWAGQSRPEDHRCRGG